jgi:hypothetical protein
MKKKYDDFIGFISYTKRIEMRDLEKVKDFENNKIKNTDEACKKIAELI